MFFNSIDFAIFLPIVFILYWFVANKSLKLQNFFIVLASYVFYAFWDWRFLGLILFSTVVDYFIGLRLHDEKVVLKRKILLWTSISVNIGLLGFFKYYNFFLDNFMDAFSYFGKSFHGDSLNIILPVGISFYTFQTLSYTIDIYRDKLKSTQNFIAFASFVSFFPQLVAGPIERASNLLPQFYKKRKFNYQQAVDGVRQILWGLFKKMIIADNCAQYANMVFNNSDDYSGSSLVLGAVFFAFQIYGDFSGYSDIAIGTSRLFGFNLKQNFAFPYFSRDIAEFWRRWHISLSTWFRDYLYIPLGGSKKGTFITIINVFIIFIVSGFWHGANWTFIIWGLLNALYFIPLFLLNKNRNHLDTVAKGKKLPSIKELFFMMITFGLTVFAWIFFRAKDLSHALSYISNLFSTDLFSKPHSSLRASLPTLFIVALFIIIEWIGRENQYGIEKLGLSWKRPYRFLFYFILFSLLLLFACGKQEFIYFQF